MLYGFDVERQFMTPLTWVKDISGVFFIVRGEETGYLHGKRGPSATWRSTPKISQRWKWRTRLIRSCTVDGDKLGYKSLRYHRRITQMRRQGGTLQYIRNGTCRKVPQGFEGKAQSTLIFNLRQSIGAGGGHWR
jgi:hypothetical protein